MVEPIGDGRPAFGSPKSAFCLENWRFADVRFRLDDQDSKEGNLGLGLRRMLAGGWNLGGYGYFDRRRGDTGHFFNQMTVGAEALGRDRDSRVNAYLPFGGRRKDLGSTGGGAATAVLSGGTVQVMTPGTTTREERALSGFDAEVGWRVPLFDAETVRDGSSAWGQAMYHLHKPLLQRLILKWLLQKRERAIPAR